MSQLRIGDEEYGYIQCYIVVRRTGNVPVWYAFNGKFPAGEFLGSHEGSHGKGNQQPLQVVPSGITGYGIDSVIHRNDRYYLRSGGGGYDSAETVSRYYYRC